MPVTPRIAILIPIHNGLEYTKRTLHWLTESIRRCGEDGDKICVVITDDGSTDGSGEWIRKEYPEFHILQGDGTLWWSGSINMAADYALRQLQCEWLVLWNNDVKPHPDYFCILHHTIMSAKAPRLIGSKINFLDPANRIWSVGFEFDPHTGKQRNIGLNQIDKGQYEEPISPDWTAGMGTTIHRDVLGAIGLWDARKFPQYFGDCDFCLRAKKAGFSIVLFPRLQIWNDKTSSGLSHDNRFGRLLYSFFTPKSLYYLRAQILFYMRHTDSALAWREFLQTYASYICSFIKWKVLVFTGLKKNKI